MIPENNFPTSIKKEGSSPRGSKNLEAAISQAQNYLLGRQNEQGYWVGELESDASVAAGYIPLMYFMRGKVDPVKQSKVINFVKSKQNEDGSWSTFKGGPGDLNVSVQVYFALKLAGLQESESVMLNAREFILSRGGLMCANTITRVWLALFGQFDYRGTPSVPPELIYLPNWFFLNIYEFASWSRDTIMALILILNTRPVCEVPAHARISELFVESPSERRFGPGVRVGLFGWKNFFLRTDGILKLVEKLPVHKLRKPALRRVEKWVVEHQEVDGSWAGILLPWIYSLMALKAMGYGPEHPVIKKGMAGLEPFILEDGHFLKMQPAVSPVWDTAWAILALRESGLEPDNPSLVKAGRWLLSQEINCRGDWSVKNPRTQPAGWAFEFHNQFYPDIDDTGG